MTNNDNYSNPDQNNRNGQEKVEESFDTIGLLLDYLSKWKYFVLSLLICLGVAYCNIRMQTPLYRVGASVYLNDDAATKTSAVTLNPMAVSSDEMAPIIDETEIEIMKSRNSLLKIVDTLQLAYSYYTQGTWRDTPIYKVNPITARMDSAQLADIEGQIVLDIDRNNDKFHVEIGNGDVVQLETTLDSIPAVVKTVAGEVQLSPNAENFDSYSGSTRIIIRNPNSVAAEMAGHLDIQYAEKAATILNFTYDCPLPELGKDVLQMLIYFYNKQIIEDKNQSAIQTEEFIQARVLDVQNELKEASNRVREYEERKNIIDRQQQITSDLSKSASIQNEIVELRTTEASLRDVLTVARSIEISASLREISMLPSSTANNAINVTIDKFNKDVQRYNRQRIDMTEEQDLITNLIATLTSQRTQIVHSLEEACKQVSKELQQKQAIENRSNSQLANQPEVAMGYKEVKLDEEVKNNILTFLLQKREEIALQKTLATPTAQFIDNPSVIEQVAPRSSMTYIIAIVVGLLIPGLIILFKRVYFPKFQEKEDIQRISSVPVIGEICRTEKDESDMVVGENISTSVAELFRLLRNNITFARTGGEKKVILLTSSVSGEGKTFVALNLAMTYALTGKRTLVIGLDIRRPVLAHKFGLSNRVGLTSYLAEQVNDVDSLIHRSELNPNLYIMPAGPIPPNPNELLMSERMATMFEHVRKEFDYIIVDTAPIGMVSDSFLIVPHSDIQLFVTRAQYTTRKGLKVLHEGINSGQLNKVYIVLNGVNTRSRAYNYRRYGNYTLSKTGYGYGYTVVSEQKSGKRSLWKRFFGRRKS